MEAPRSKSNTDGPKRVSSSKSIRSNAPSEKPITRTKYGTSNSGFNMGLFGCCVREKTDAPLATQSTPKNTGSKTQNGTQPQFPDLRESQTKFMMDNLLIDTARSTVLTEPRFSSTTIELPEKSAKKKPVRATELPRAAIIKEERQEPITGSFNTDNFKKKSIHPNPEKNKQNLEISVPNDPIVLNGVPRPVPPAKKQAKAAKNLFLTKPEVKPEKGEDVDEIIKKIDETRKSFVGSQVDHTKIMEDFAVVGSTSSNLQELNKILSGKLSDTAQVAQDIPDKPAQVQVQPDEPKVLDIQITKDFKIISIQQRDSITVQIPENGESNAQKAPRKLTTESKEWPEHDWMTEDSEFEGFSRSATLGKGKPCLLSEVPTQKIPEVPSHQEQDASPIKNYSSYPGPAPKTQSLNNQLPQRTTLLTSPEKCQKTPQKSPRGSPSKLKLSTSQSKFKDGFSPIKIPPSFFIENSQLSSDFEVSPSECIFEIIGESFQSLSPKKMNVTYQGNRIVFYDVSKSKNRQPNLRFAKTQSFSSDLSAGLKNGSDIYKSLYVQTLVIDKNNKVLLTQKPSTSSYEPLGWLFPSAEIFAGENPRLNAKNDLKQQTSLEFQIEAFKAALFLEYSVVGNLKDDQCNLINLLVYVVKVDRDCDKDPELLVKLKKPDVHKYDWVPMEDLLKVSNALEVVGRGPPGYGWLSGKNRDAGKPREGGLVKEAATILMNMQEELSRDGLSISVWNGLVEKDKSQNPGFPVRGLTIVKGKLHFVN